MPRSHRGGAAYLAALHAGCLRTMLRAVREGMRFSKSAGHLCSQRLNVACLLGKLHPNQGAEFVRVGSGSRHVACLRRQATGEGGGEQPLSSAHLSTSPCATRGLSSSDAKL